MVEVEEVLPNIYKILIPLPKNPLKFLNSYLIKGRERNLLIDTGFNQEECRTAMLAALDGLGVDLAETDLFITHMHADHSGLITALATEKSVVYCSEMDGYLINCCASSVFLSEMYALLASYGFPLHELDAAVEEHPVRKYNVGKEQVFTHVKENDIIEVGDYVFKCVEMPGHSPGQVCLYEVDHKFLIAGDHLLEEITPIIKHTKWSSDSLGDYLNSLDKVDQMDIVLVLPAHRRIFFDAHKRVAEMKRHHQNRLDEVLKILADGQMTAYQVARRMTWQVRYSSWEEFPATQKWFAATEAISHLVYLCNKNIIRRIDNENETLFALI